MKFAANKEHFRREYGDLSGAKELWEAIPTIEGAVYQWDPKSTFIKEPPFFEGVTRVPGKVNDVKGARALAILGDSITTDHISPSTKIKTGTPAGKWLEGYNSPPSEWGTFSACAAAIMSSWCAARSPTCACATRSRPVPKARSPSINPTARR